MSLDYSEKNAPYQPKLLNNENTVWILDKNLKN